MRHPETSTDSYRFAVGDLCFETLGEIVNRYLPASNDYSSGDRSYHLINSPVHSPALAAAVRADWSGLTAEGLKQSLIEDVQRLPEDDPPVDGLQRLLFYYPDDGRALAVQFFQRPVCVFSTVGIFLYKTLLVTDNEKEQDHLLTEFREKNGEESYRPLTQSLVLIANGTPNLSGNEEEDREMTQQFENAKRIVARHFAAMNQHPRAVEITADCDSQRAIVETVKTYPSHEIDQAVRDLLKRTLALKPSDVEDKLSQCWLASACMQRLVAPALGKTIDREGENLNGPMPPNDSDAKTKQTYIHRCDRFLQKWAKKFRLSKSGALADAENP